ncbi:PPE domain-containing protein [Lentzea sp. NPDC006480]|uniref:PPE domain-containing protein n=1 Tax=Lentzea sp. NPDC006480 TaxID=3157176 RepID=UPI0033A3D665
MTRPAPSCFSEDTSRAEAFTGHQIYAQMHGGPGTGPAQHAADKASELERTYAGVEARLKKVGETLGEAWSGASADAAQAAANPINQAMIQMQDALRQADHSLSNQVYQFNLNKGQLKNMPESKPETGFWDDATPWDTDTEDAVNSYNSEESHNRNVYKEFQSASNTNRGELPKQFPGVTADTLNVEVINTGGDDGRDKTGNNVNNSSMPHGTPTFPSSTGNPQGTTGTTWTPPGSVTGGNDTTTSQAVGGDVNSPLRTEFPGGGKPPVGGVIDRPPNTGIPPIGVPVGPGGLNGPGGTGGGRGPGGGAGRGPGGPGGSGAGGKFGGGSGSGRLGGGGLGGVGSGSSGTAGQQQPGGKSGVFGGMGAEGGPNAAGRGGVGAAGRGGAAGAGGMGGHGQKGQGEDDLEHKSADYLVTEENTNEIIGDMPMVAPPTIGG